MIRHSIELTHQLIYNKFPQKIHGPQNNQSQRLKQVSCRFDSAIPIKQDGSRELGKPMRF